MDCAESSCDTVRYETFSVRVVTGFVKIILNDKRTGGGNGGFREIRALSVVPDGKTTQDRCVRMREGEKKSMYMRCVIEVQRIQNNIATKKMYM